MSKHRKWPFMRGVRLLAAAAVCTALALILAPVPAAAPAAAQTALALPETENPSARAAVACGQKLIPLGRTTGIKLYSPGTMVVGFAELDGGARSPAESAGLEIGDVIVAFNGSKVGGNEALMTQLSQLEDGEAVLTVLRDGVRQETAVDAVYDEELQCWRIGAWVRDSIAGIGTITFVDPATGAFGALGHGVCDTDTGELMPFGTGSLMASKVTDVRRGSSGSPGQLTGSFDLYHDQGTLSGNTAAGLFGQLDDPALYEDREAVETAPRSEIHSGRVTVLSNVHGTETRAYDAEIVKLYPNGDDGREFMLRITDPALLEATGGIVQGMSGSPILQDGRLIGAVTHVLVNDAARGYGISIETMLSAAPAA